MEHKRARGVIKIVGIVIGCILLWMLILFFIFSSWHPGKIEPFLGDDGAVIEGSINEIVHMDIGGVEQGMILSSRNTQNPVLLFLHGGPGNPEYALARDAEVGLEEVFTVCWWEQRGSGMSYESGMDAQELTLEQYVNDAVEVTNYLRERFGQDKIYLMGHSWGTFLGVQTAAQYPELYQAYIGVGQISDQMQSEKLAYSYMLEELSAQGNEKLLKKLEQYTLSDAASVTPQYLALRSEILSALGNGVYHEAKSKLSMLTPILTAREYTLSDLYGYAKGALISLESPANQACYTTDLRKSVPALEIPVYLFHGVYDKQVSYELAKDYFEVLQAPEKQFYTFEESAHSPFLEEPALFMTLIKAHVLM